MLFIDVLRQQDPETWSMATLQQIGELANDLQNMEKIEEAKLCLFALTEALAIKNACDYALYYARLVFAHVLLEDGEVDEADKQFKKIPPDIMTLEDTDIELWEKQVMIPITGERRQNFFTYLYLVFGKKCLFKGRYDKAQKLFEKGLYYSTSTFSCGLSRTHAPSIRLALAQLQMECGDFKSAKDTLKELDKDPSEPLGTKLSVSRKGILAKICWMQGLFHESYGYLEENVQISSERKWVYPLLDAYEGMAEIHLFLQQTYNAEKILGAIKTTKETFGLCEEKLKGRIESLSKRIERARRVNSGYLLDVPTVHELRHSQKTPISSPKQEAEDSSAFVESVEQRLPEKLRNSPSILGWFENCARHLYALMMDVNTHSHNVIKFFCGVWDRFSDYQSTLIQTRLQFLLGILCFKEQEFEKSLKIFKNAEKEFEETGYVLKAFQSQALSLECHRQLNTSCLDLIKRHYSTMQRIGKHLRKEDKQTWMIGLSSAKEKLLIELFEQFVDDNASKNNPIVSQEDQQMQIFRLFWEEFGTDSVPDLQDFMKGIPCHLCVIVCLALPDRVVLMSLTNLEFHFKQKKNLTKEKLKKYIQDFYEILKSHKNSRDIQGNTQNQQPNQNIQEMQEILREIEQELEFSSILPTEESEIKNISFVFRDQLLSIPFCVFPYRQKLLCEIFSISFGQSLASKQVYSKKNARVFAKALLVGESRGGKSVYLLPNVAKEISHIKTCLEEQKIEVITHVDGCTSPQHLTKWSIPNLLEQVDIAHFACHGLISPEKADESGLLLFGEDGTEQFMTLRQIENLQLQKLRLVTIAACWSADQFILPGRTLVSVPMLFLASGASCVMGCLWEVDDQASVSFMRRFYELLASHPEDAALQKTQIECIEKKLLGCGGIDMSHPWFWSGYKIFVS